MVSRAHGRPARTAAVQALTPPGDQRTPRLLLVFCQVTKPSSDAAGLSHAGSRINACSEHWK